MEPDSHPQVSPVKRPCRQITAVGQFPSLAAENSNAVGPKKQTRKRRSLSCQKCRKLKTRCDFDSEKGMCHRCFVLRLECSLSDGKPLPPPTAAPPNNVAVRNEEMTSFGRPTAADSSAACSSNTVDESAIDARLRGLEQGLQKIHEYLRALTPVIQTQRIAVNKPDVQIRSEGIGLSNSPKNDGNRAPRRLCIDHSAAPLSVIRSIDYQLFSRAERYEPMNVAGQTLLAWMSQRRQYCRNMCQTFLAKCSRDVIRSELSLSDLTEHSSVLLQGTMMLQGMRCDDQSSHNELQPQLFPIVRNLLSTALMTTPLLYEDIEAMLYLSHFNAARKPRQPILDSWLLTGSAVKSFLLSVNFCEVIRRADRGSSGEGDLYLLRLWNGICLCHLQYAVATWRPVMIPSDHLDQCGKISSMMGSNPIDTTNSAEIALLVILSRQLSIQPSSPEFPRDLQEWKSRYELHFGADQTHMLEISFAYAHVILACKFIHEHRDRPEEIPRQLYLDAIAFSSNIIRIFLDLPPSKIEGMPNYPLCILIYACLTLTSFIQQSYDRHSTLNLITRVYWYLYHMGERSKDILNSISLIIKSLIDNASRQVLDFRPVDDFKGESMNNIQGMDKRLAMQPMAVPQVPQVPQVLQVGQAHIPEYNNMMGTSNSSVVPDISQYRTFDEFFEVVFSKVNRSPLAA